MVGVALLLQELIVIRLIFGLPGLLLQLASTKLRLTALQRSLLRRTANPCQTLADASAHAVQPLAKPLQLLRGTHLLGILLLRQGSLLRGSASTHAIKLLGSLGALPKQLLANACLRLRSTKTLAGKLLRQRLLCLGRTHLLAILKLRQGSLLLRCLRRLIERLLTQRSLLLRHTQTLAKQLLAQGRPLLSGRKVLPKALLANPKHLLRGLLLRQPVGLLRRKLKALLLLGRRHSLTIALLVNVAHRLGRGEALLLGKNSLGNTATITTKGAAFDLIPQNALLLHLLLLPQGAHRGFSNRLHVGRHIAVNAQAFWRKLPRASKAILRGQFLIRRSGSLGRANAAIGLLLDRLGGRSRRTESLPGCTHVGLSLSLRAHDIGNGLMRHRRGGGHRAKDVLRRLGLKR